MANLKSKIEKETAIYTPFQGNKIDQKFYSAYTPLPPISLPSRNYVETIFQKKNAENKGTLMQISELRQDLEKTFEKPSINIILKRLGIEGKSARHLFYGILVFNNIIYNLDSYFIKRLVTEYDLTNQIKTMLKEYLGIDSMEDIQKASTSKKQTTQVKEEKADTITSTEGEKDIQSSISEPLYSCDTSYSKWLVCVVLGEILPMEQALSDTKAFASILDTFLKLTYEDYSYLHTPLTLSAIKVLYGLLAEEMKTAHLPTDICSVDKIQIKVPYDHQELLRESTTIRDFITRLETTSQAERNTGELSNYPQDMDILSFTCIADNGQYTVVYSRPMRESILSILSQLSVLLGYPVVTTTLYNAPQISEPLLITTQENIFSPTGYNRGKYLCPNYKEKEFLCIGKTTKRFFKVGELSRYKGGTVDTEKVKAFEE